MFANRRHIRALLQQRSTVVARSARTHCGALRSDVIAAPQRITIAVATFVSIDDNKINRYNVGVGDRDDHVRS